MNHHAEKARTALDSLIDYVTEVEGELALGTQALALAKREIECDDTLLASYKRVLAAIPECPLHGDDCVPHALGWINDARKREAPHRPPPPVSGAACAPRTEHSITETLTFLLGAYAPRSQYAAVLRVHDPAHADLLWVAWSMDIRGAGCGDLDVDGEVVGLAGHVRAPVTPWYPIPVIPGPYHIVRLLAASGHGDGEVRSRSLHVVVGGERPMWEPGSVRRG